MPHETLPREVLLSREPALAGPASGPASGPAGPTLMSCGLGARLLMAVATLSVLWSMVAWAAA